MFDRLDEILKDMAGDRHNGEYITSLASEIGRIKTEYMASRSGLLSKMKDNDTLRDALAAKDSEITMLKNELKRQKLQNEDVLQLVDNLNMLLMLRKPN